MGYYLNPYHISKEEFLTQYGTEIEQPTTLKPADENVVVCLVNNGAFTAAALMNTQAELQSWNYPDRRPRKWYSISKDTVKQNCLDLVEVIDAMA